MLEILARASLDGAFVICAVWIVNRALPRLSPGAKTMLWWCAAAKVVVALAWLTPVAIPILPAEPVAATTRAAPTTSVTTPAAGASSNPIAARADVDTSAGVRWPWILTAIWGFGLCVSAGLSARRWRQTRRVVKRSGAAGSIVQQSAREIAERLDLRRVPEVRFSDEVESPLITGVFRPVILVPARRFPALSGEQQRMALCHELAHVKRGDVWLGCVPAAAERLFFFHPHVRLAAREYAFWREAACDAAVLAALDTAPQAYGRLLLDLGVAQPTSALAAAGAAWSFSNLKRRIVMLNRPSRPSLPARILATVTLAFAVAAVAPLRLVARPSAQSAAMVPPATLSGHFESPASESTVPEAQSKQRASSEEPLRFVFFIDGQHTTMSGSTGDMERARRLRTSGGPMLWFRSGGNEYVVRHPGVLREVQEIWEPVNRIGDEQGKVGTKQGEIGTRQGEIGTKQGEIGTEQGKLGTRQGALGTRQGVLAAREGGRLSDAERADIDRERQALEKEMRQLDREMQALTLKMRELERPMRDLGEDMEILGREMEVLGRKMEEASSKAETDMRALLERAIAAGTAERVR
jgi:bla regulator protein BlaR1